MRRVALILILLLVAGCAAAPRAAGPPEDREFSLAVHRARAAFEEGAISRAVDLYGQALHRALAMDDAVEIGNAAYNLALCRIILGQFDRASAALADARTAFQRSGSDPAEVLLLEATVAQRQGHWEQALSLADRVLAVSRDENHRLQAVLLQGTVACRQGDMTRARTAWAEAGRHPNANTALSAARERLAGGIFQREGNAAAAAAAWDRAADLFQKARHYRDMALALYRAGEAYQEAGDTARAEDRLMRARRSLAAQGQETP